ncbi:pyridoxal-phosphate dependent enzyme [Sinomonas humi]|uniref:pyridoxal-phosphate dependent enzyme n=1 Tax=Sinomonas humi TaxID=1338436 RepID=UPI0018CFC04D|nr:pyridoxal-phosphate dependent enzyme [Sinomonas humi]
MSAPATGEKFDKALARDPNLGIWRWESLLPVHSEAPITLGEGNTPLIRLDGVGKRSKAGSLYLKNEASNPTWTHKDRLSAAAVTAASVLGASAVVAASTGNHGASIAAYAARGNMRCIISTYTWAPETMRTLMEVYGAEVHGFERSEQRYEMIAVGAAESGWYPCSNSTWPPVGSPPYGVDGYKTIAYELWEQLPNQSIDAVVVPTGYGDCIRGIARGFDDLREAGVVDYSPKLIAAEVFGKISRSLRSSSNDLGPESVHPTTAFSISNECTTYQALDAVRSNGGRAVSVSEEDILGAQVDLARLDGLYVEASSAVAVAAVQQAFRSGILHHDDTVVLVSTSSGLKDPGTTAEFLAQRKRRSDVGASDATPSQSDGIQRADV